MQRPLVILAALLFLWPAEAAEKLFDFSEHKLNESPRGFRSTVSGSGGPGDWRIILDDGDSLLAPISPKAPAVNKRAVLAQLARDRTDEHFPLLIFEGESFGDFTLTTRLKMVDGQEEQMAGIAFRIQDEKNYYYVRASSLGSSFYFFKIVDGVRSAPIGAKLEIPKGVWHEMTVECKGNEIRALWNGKEVIPILGDKSFTSGKIAFWTKSDAVSYFADTKLTYTPKEIFAQVLVRDALQKYPRVRGLKIFAAPPNQTQGRMIASDDPKEVGKPAEQAEQDTMTRSMVYHGKINDSVVVTLPLHDSNGETVAAVKVIMKAFAGQTEKNAIARALPIIKRMESRLQSANDLVQ